MDWQVKSVSKQSQISGQAFEPGQKIISFLFKDKSGDLQRVDVLESEVEKFSSSGTVLGWWCQWVKDESDEAKTKRESIKTSEELFLSLYAEELEPSEDRDILKNLLAIILERKRILKPVGKSTVGKPQKYLLTKTKEEFEVPSVDLTAEAILKIQEQLWAMVR